MGPQKDKDTDNERFNLEKSVSFSIVLSLVSLKKKSIYAQKGLFLHKKDAFDLQVDLQVRYGKHPILSRHEKRQARRTLRFEDCNSAEEENGLYLTGRKTRS